MTRKKTIYIKEEIISRQTYEIDFIQMYQAFCNKIFLLNPNCEIALLIYCLVNMDEENYFVYNQRFRDKFQAFCEASDIKPYLEVSVQRALAKLKANGFVINDIKGQYRVNIEYFWKDSIESRTKELNKLKKDKPKSK